MEKTPPPSFSGLLYGLISKIELLMLVALVVGLGFKRMDFPGGDQILMISLSVLAAVFFLMAYRPPVTRVDGEAKLGFSDLLFAAILPKISWLSCSVLVIGILFTILHLPGNKQILIVGTAAGALVLLIIAFGFLQNNEKAKALVPVLYRLVPLAALGAYFMTL